jgi:hypothetical protein
VNLLAGGMIVTTGTAGVYIALLFRIRVSKHPLAWRAPARGGSDDDATRRAVCFAQREGGQTRALSKHTLAHAAHTRVDGAGIPMQFVHQIVQPRLGKERTAV